VSDLDINVFPEGIPSVHVVANVVSLTDLVVLVKEDFVVNPDPELFIIPGVHLPELELDLDCVMGRHLKHSCHGRSGTKHTSATEDFLGATLEEDIVSLVRVVIAPTIRIVEIIAEEVLVEDFQVCRD
jgi:hypothetical protein